MRTNNSHKLIELIHAQLSKGGVPWTKPWVVRPDSIISYSSGKPYTSLVNCMLLSYAGEWATLRQINKLGGRVKKGEHGCQIFGSGRIHVKEKSDDGEEVTRQKFVRSVWTVFRIGSQTEGVECKYRDLWEAGGIRRTDTEVNRVVSEYCARSGVKLMAGGSEAFYSRTDDAVQVPGWLDFKGVPAFWHTVFHELSHSTGATQRLNRDLGDATHEDAYATEELVADISACLCLGRLGIDTSECIPNTAAYCASWSKRIASYDDSLFRKCVKDAQAAVDYIFGTTTPTTPQED